MLTENTTCYRHPSERAAVGCQRCERPICPSCMTQASIGYHCPECRSQGSQQIYTPRNMPGDGITATKVLIAVNVFLFVVQTATQGRLTDWGVLWGPYVERGDWWRIISSGFLHRDILHIAFNGYGLWILGKSLEEGIGKARFLMVYAAGLLGGSFAVLAFDFMAPTLGASGAVLGLAGGMAAVLWARGISLTQTPLGFILALNLALPVLIGGISFWGHFGGILAGFAAGWLLSWLPGRFGQSNRVAVAATAGLCLALLAATVFAVSAEGLL